MIEGSGKTLNRALIEALGGKVEEAHLPEDLVVAPLGKALPDASLLVAAATVIDDHEPLLQQPCRERDIMGDGQRRRLRDPHDLVIGTVSTALHHDHMDLRADLPRLLTRECIPEGSAPEPLILLYRPLHILQ